MSSPAMTECELMRGPYDGGTMCFHYPPPPVMFLVGAGKELERRYSMTFALPPRHYYQTPHAHYPHEYVLRGKRYYYRPQEKGVKV